MSARRTAGYPPQDPDPGDALVAEIQGVAVKARVYGPARRRTILLTAAEETAWSRGGSMVLLSAGLLRKLLTKARLPRRRSLPPHHIDIRV